jgi:hypothetical protein
VDAALGNTTGGVDQVEPNPSSGGSTAGETGSSDSTSASDDGEDEKPSVSGPMADVWNTE